MGQTENERYALVKKANELIQKSRFSLDTQQQKIILYLISKISYQDEDFKRYKFSIRNFCKVCGIDYDNGKNYRELKAEIKALRDESKWVKIGDCETTISWIEKAYIYPQKGIVEIRLDNDLKPYLLQLQRNYTQYELIYTLRFKSKYSIRLYELIKSLQYDEFHDFSRGYKIEKLRELLGAETYTDFKNFRRRVLEPAINEINTYSDKTVSYEAIKEEYSRRIYAVKLIIKSKSIEERLETESKIEKELKGIPALDTDPTAEQLSLFDDEKIEI